MAFGEQEHHGDGALERVGERVQGVEAAPERAAWFRVRFGLLQAKAYLKGEHVLRMEATVRNTRELRCGRSLEHFPEIVTRLAAMAGRFATTLDCAGISFIADGTLGQLALPGELGQARVSGTGLNKPRIRAALPAALALTAAPRGYTVTELTAKIQAMTRQAGYTTRKAAYDLRKLRGKQLVEKPGRSRRYPTPTHAARTIAALLALRDQVIAPILADVRSPRTGRKPAIWTRIDRDYETLRIGMQALFHDLGITAAAA